MQKKKKKQPKNPPKKPKKPNSKPTKNQQKTPPKPKQTKIAFALNSGDGKIMTRFRIDLPIQFFHCFSSHSFGRGGGVRHI